MNRLSAKFRARAVCWTLAMAFAAPVHAIEAGTADAYLSMSLDDLLNVSLTSSTMSEETIRSVPAAMTVYTREQIRDLGIRTLDALIDFVPGYQTEHADEASFSRTFSSRGRRLGTSGREVLVLMDGVRLNGVATGGATVTNMLIPLDNVERVEFIRGPGSSIYGSNAIMGVINVITRNVAQHGVGEANIEIGNTWRNGSAQMQVGETQRGFSLFAKQGYDSGQSLAICDADSAQCNRLAASKVLTETRDPYGHKELYLRGQWDEFSGSLRWAERNASQFYSLSTVNNQNNRSEATTAFLRLAWERKLAQHMSIHAEIFQNQQTISSTTSLHWGAVPDLMDYGYKEREPGIQLMLQDNTPGNRWLLGVEQRYPALYDVTAYPRNSAPFTMTSEHRMASTVAGYFAQYQTTFAEKTQLTLGLRQDEYSNFGGHLSQRLGLTHQVGERDTVKYLYSTSFRAPSPFEIYIDNGSDYLQNKALRPEVASNHELVWVRTLDSALFSSSLYSSDVADAIHETAVVDPLNPANFLRTWKNGHERVTGWEFEWQQQLNQAWSTRFALTHMFSRAHAYSSEAASLLSASLVYKAGAWLGSLRMNYQGPRMDKLETDGLANTVENVKIGGHALLGAHLAYRLSSAHEVYAHVDNLFNRRYVSPAQRFIITTGIPERGRMVSAGLRWSF